MPGFARRCLAVAAALALVLGLPVSAAAQDIARVAPESRPGATIRLANGGAAETALYRLVLGEDTGVPAYCADISTSVDSQAAYAESSWESGDAPTADAAAPAAVSWIVTHSYPLVGLERLRAAAGVAGLDRTQAIAATQAAIWHHTNGVELDRATGGGGRNAPALLGLYDYLLEGAREHADEPPGATLELTPGRVEGADPGRPIGPLTVGTTSAGPVAVWVQGAPNGRLTDPRGETVESVRDGEEFYLRLPPEAPAGVATVYASAADAVVRPGLLFAGKDGVLTQPLVAAEYAVAPATAAVKVDWVREEPAAAAEPRPAPAGPEASAQEADAAEAPAALPSASPTAASPTASSEEVVVADDRRPEDHLARTGTWLGTVLIVGLALVAIGAATLYLARRRRSL